MFTEILTWAGALLGITVLLVMAFGAVAIDFDSAHPRAWHLPWRRVDAAKHAKHL